jgi:putative hydrolase of the HAD superfamily
MPKVKLIAFDLFGVIIEEGHLIRNVLKPLLPPGLDRSRVKPLYNDYNLALISEQEFWNGIGIEDYTDISQCFLNAFRTDPDYPAVIQQLGTNYRLSILSNLPPDWADALTARFHLEQTFSPIIFSGHLRQKKPERGIYQALVEQTKLTPDQILFIDDRLENLATAAAMGMHTVYYQREQETHSFVPDYRINHLAQLITLASDQ